MGRGRRGRGGKNRGKGRSDTWLKDPEQMNNVSFNNYYKSQNILAEDEWEPFLQSMRTFLPTTFRVAGSRQSANELNETIKTTYVPSLGNLTFEGEPVVPPMQIPWYPDGLAWQLNVSKTVLRKSPEFKKFHNFLVFETEVGNISRQEAVSMLPPLFLDVEPHHKVMDMCAAPGSKTAQLLEALHAQDTLTSTSTPSGLLIANDTDAQRTHMLIHQSARLPSPAFMVTNVDASSYPVIRIPQESSSGTGIVKLRPLQFDRILCDVPCSGDGTIRKNVGIWGSWTPNNGNGIHGLQLRILQRAMKLLKDDGRIVYSTCSLNPIENEAVIAAALKTNPEFYLVDVSSKLPELLRRPGLTTWQVTTDRNAEKMYTSFEAFKKSNPEWEAKTKVSEGHFPPPDADQLGLTKCMRIYPHLQDTGGFFVAVLQRHPELPKERKRTAQPHSSGIDAKRPKLDSAELSTDIPEPPSVPEAATDSSKQEASVPTGDDVVMEPPKEEETSVFKENPFTFLEPDNPVLRHCIEKLNITPDFPSSNTLVRHAHGEALRYIYLVNDLAKTVIQSNDYARIRLTSAGTKIFVKQEGGSSGISQFRILSGGLPVVLPYIDPTSILDVDMESLKILVESYYPLCETLMQPFRGIIEGKPPGGHIVRLSAQEINGIKISHDLLLPLWKSKTSITLMIEKKGKSALSLRLFGKDITTAGRESEQKIAAKAQIQNVDELAANQDAEENEALEE